MLVEAVQSLLVKIGENKMTKQKFNNIWTKLGLGWLRGNPVFKGLWRGLRVAAVTGFGCFLATFQSGQTTEASVAAGVLAGIGAALEKWMRIVQEAQKK